MRIIKTKIYLINEHPNQELCFDWIRDNWHDLNEHSLYDLINSLKELSKTIGGTLDYSIACNPDRGEYITFKNYDTNILNSLDCENLPLTGVWWDYEVIKGLQENDIEKVLNTLHEETEYQYSKEGITNMCESNNYEFTIDGIVI